VTFLEAATPKPIVIRALKIGAVVGTILTAINHGDKLLTQSLADGDLMKIAMTYCVPYCVSTYSAASALVARES